jgi:hypothetical protein
MVLCALLGSIGATLCAFAYWGIVIVSLQSKDAEEEEECAGRYYWRRERNRFITFTSRRAPKGKLPGPLSLSLARTLNIIPSAPTQTTIYRDAPRGNGPRRLPAESNRTAQK